MRATHLARLSGSLIALVAVLALVATGCGSSAADESASTSVERLQYRDSNYEGTDGAGSVVDIHVPDSPDGLATVVLLHGFASAPGSPDMPLRNFAPAIARLGAVVFEFQWQSAGITADSRADLSCIGPFVKAHASAFGADPDHVVVVGHSMGGEMGSLLALSSFGLPVADDCVERGASPRPTGFLGLGGAYGVTAMPLDDEATAFQVNLHPQDDPFHAAADDEVSPGLTAEAAYGLVGYSALPTDNPVSMVLLVGELDAWTFTNLARSTAFGDALDQHGVDVEVIEVPAAGHNSVVEPTTAGGIAALAVIEDLIATTP